jgi:hypothetical protein
MYEHHINDSIIIDTTLIEREQFNEDGFKYKKTNFDNNVISFEEQYFEDSLRLVFLHDPEINPKDRIEYWKDSLGGTTAIISRDTTLYTNYYKGSLIRKVICNGGKRNVSEYFYNQNSNIERLIMYGKKTDTLTSSWEYDIKDRVVKHTPAYSNSIWR